MRSNWVFVIIILGLSLTSTAQLNYPTVTSASGGVITTNNFTLEWTLGEMAVETISTQTSMYTQGFHQPKLKVDKIHLLPDIMLSNKVLNVYPNPVSSLLTIEVGFISDVSLFLMLFDAKGHLLLKQQVLPKERVIHIDIQHYNQGTYFLQINNINGSPISISKVVKFR